MQDNAAESHTTVSPSTNSSDVNFGERLGFGSGQDNQTREQGPRASDNLDAHEDAITAETAF